MKCRICGGDKLSREFIPYSLTPECKHPRLMCLRCATDGSKNNGKCPYKDCGAPIAEKSEEVAEFKTRLNFLFTEIYPMSDDLAPPVDQAGTSSTINIVMMTGEHRPISFRPNQTVLQLKKDIFHELNVAVEKQKLLYDGAELKDYTANGTARLSDFNISSNSTVYLLVILYSLPSNLTHVTFDLSWNYPNSGKDYLDATCLVYSKSSNIENIDYRNTFMAPEWAIRYSGSGINERGDAVYFARVDHAQKSIVHTGDEMNDSLRIGKHKIDVYINRLPANITNMFFTLSAWKHATISHFPNPTLKFYERSNPGVNLCETTFNNAKYSSSVIMCSLSLKDGQWRVIGLGTPSTGNAKNYSPLKQKIQCMISEGKC